MSLDSFLLSLVTGLHAGRSTSRRARRRRPAGGYRPDLQSLERRFAFAADSVPAGPFFHAAAGPTKPAALVLTATTDRAGNSLANGRQITVGPSTSSYADWVGTGDRNDYYRFSLGTTSDLRLALNGLSADADLSLLRSDGSVIAASATRGKGAESIARRLEPGTYGIWVRSRQGNTNYSLRASAIQVLPSDSAGNTLADARSIVVGEASTTYTDWVGAADIKDYYRFTLATRSTLNLTLGGLSADADVNLRDASGVVVASSSASGAMAETIERELDADTYFVEVYPYEGSTDYSLRLSAASTVVPDLAGNTLATARLIAVDETPTTFQDWVGTADSDDFYRFTLSAQGTFRASVAGLAAGANGSLMTADGMVLVTVAGQGGNAAVIERVLAAGTYAISVSRAGGDTAYSLEVSAVSGNPPVTDWYTKYLHDAEIVSLTRTLAADGNLSRSDMLAVFRSAEDGGVVSIDELDDLRTVVRNGPHQLGGGFTMVDDVQFLSSCVAGDNPRGQGANERAGIGNLTGGSPQSQLESLVGKWFLGTDRPDIPAGISAGYSFVAGSLYQNGPQADDVVQGMVGTCYLLATLSSIAQEKPEVIKNMFVDNGDNTWTVRFDNGGFPLFVTVDRYLPASGGNRVFAGWGGGTAASASNELWVALAEKAYAQLKELNGGGNAYAEINGGWTGTVIAQIGLRDVSLPATSITQSQLIAAVSSSQILTLSNGQNDSYGMVKTHAYAITSYDAATGRFHLQNPWGVRHVDLTFAQIKSLNCWIVASVS